MNKLFTIISYIFLFGTIAFGQVFDITPASLNFGNVALGSDSTMMATVSNPGTSDLVITNIVSSDLEFTFTPNVFPITITPGGNQVFNVVFTPTSTGLKTANLTITHNATGSPTVYSVQGTGVEPTFGILPASLNFGNVALGSDSTMMATVSNPGTSDLVITNIVSSDLQFTFTPNTFPVTITPGGNQVINVVFTPTSTGLKTANLTITHNATGSPTVYSVQGTGVEPTFGILPASLNFGNVALGSDSTMMATVSNPGTSDLVITNIVSSDLEFTFTPNVFPITITPGGNQVFNVVFTPTSTGLKTANLTITHNATGSPTVYSVQGTGVEPTFGILPASLNFGNVALGSDSTMMATVSNPGTSDLVITNIVSSDLQFTFTPNVFPITITPGGNQVFNVVFTPTSTGLNTANLTITHNATGSPTVYSVQGTGVEPTFGILPASLNFGNVALGSDSTMMATVSNPGTSDLVITNIVSSDLEFTFTPNVFPITITPGGNQVFNVVFTPTSTGLKTANLTITHNATGSPTVYSVQGTGVEPTFGILPASLNFGNVALGSDSTMMATVSNPGTSDLVITNIVSSDLEFTFTPNVFPITITPGGNQVFNVVFTPTSTGLNTANLTITHNATGSPTVYSVQGTGVEPTFGILPASLNFGNVALGSDSTMMATVSNPGTSDLVITNIVSSDLQFTFTPNTFPITITPGGNQVINVVFTPTSTGLKTANLTITHNATGSPTVYSVQGTGVEPTFGILPASLNFGNVALGSDSTMMATVSNPGTSDLVITNIVSSDLEFTFTPNVFPITITPGGNQVFNVVFTPTSTGLKTANLTITHNATGSPTVYSVQGTGVEPTFGILPASLNFGNVALGSDSTMMATVSNPGTSDLVITNIVSSDLQFTFTPNVFPITITPGGNQVFNVVFTPTSTGLKTANLTITHNATGSPTVYSVQGTGVEPTFGILPASLNFGNVALGSDSTMMATVSNPGTSDLVITNIVSSDLEFTFTPNVFPITITPGGNQVFNVVFTPTSTGLKTANLTITHNATGSPTVYSVQGTGVEPTFGILPASLNFGNVALGSDSTMMATVSNPGTSDLVITNIVSSDLQFTFTPNVFPITITPGGNQVFNVVFTPTSTGLKTANLTITHNATGSPTVYSVQGTGVEPTFGILPASLNFGNVALGSDSTMMATVSNPGTSDLVITNIVSSDLQFTFTPNVFPITITPGGNQVFNVVFTPTSTGLKTANLTITHNATGSPTVYSVQGTGVEPTFGILPASLNFGNVALGSDSTMMATVSNPGTSDLVITNIVSSDLEFTFTPNVFPITITPGGNQVFNVVFTPTSTGLKTANLTITHNATGSPTVYSVQGTGVEPTFGILPASLNFGNVALGSDSTMMATVSNPGTSDLVITNIVSSDLQFTFTPNTFPVTITPGGNQVINVVFTPTSTGLKTANLTITHNATGSPTVYSVQGTGVNPIVPAINYLNLVNVIIGTITDSLITVTNNTPNSLLVTGTISGSTIWHVFPDTVTIPAGGNRTFMISFLAPVIPGIYNSTLIFSAVNVLSSSVQLSANVVSEAGLIFDEDTVYRIEDNTYMEILQLKNLPDSLHALQFRLQVNKEISDNTILTFLNIQKGTDVSDSSWMLISNIVRGPITPNGASKDEIFVLLYNQNQGSTLLPGNYNELFKVNYRVVNLPALQDSVKSTYKITHVEASSYQGIPINITPSLDILNVIALNNVTWHGDINIDGYLDILDLLLVVDHIVNIDSLEGNEFFRADIAPWLPGNATPEPDGFVNVQELSLIQNIILTGFYPNGLSTSALESSLISKQNDDVNATITFYINEKGIEVYLDTEVGIRGAQIEFAHLGNDPGNMIIDTDLGQGFYFYASQDKILRTLMYDPLGEKYIQPGEHILAEMPFDLINPEEVTLDNLILVDVEREKVENVEVQIVYGKPNTVPEEYYLSQNYPNPFNPGTTIEFSLPEDVSNVKLSVYNTLGEKIAELVNTSLTAGSYQYKWSPQSVATGIYIYELRTEKFVSVKKMIFMK